MNFIAEYIGFKCWQCFDGDSWCPSNMLSEGKDVNAQTVCLNNTCITNKIGNKNEEKGINIICALYFVLNLSPKSDMLK